MKTTAKPEPITRENIADMEKADVDDLQEMRGASTDENLREQRNRLIATMFVTT